MNLVVINAALYANDEDYQTLDLNPWRIYLKTLGNLEWRDLNYYSNADFQSVIDSINSWMTVDDEPLTVESFPFFTYYKHDINSNKQPKLIIHRTLDDLQNDNFLKTFK